MTPENAEWIKKAIQASKNYQNGFPTSPDQSQDFNNVGGGPSSTGGKKASLAMISPTLNIPSAATVLPLSTSGRNSPALQQIDSPKLRPDMTDSNVKRARLLLEKKKKLFLDK